ncbi:MAG TPA: knotted carbamoyltransferase YgeW [bacterium]|nr:knotted carbamoyltransferase YgeW [bacterium]
MKKSDIIEHLKNLEAMNFQMFGKDFLLTWEKSFEDIKATLETAGLLKAFHENNISTKLFESGLGISVFKDNSTRTRFSFVSALNLLGLTLMDLDEGKSQIAHGETVRETANMISFLSEAIGIRHDMFIGEGNSYMKEVGEALDDGYKNGVLNQRPTIVNLQCDIDHPTQTMADLCWLKEYFGSLDNLKGKKIAMTWAYSPSYGKPLSVPQGIIGLMTRLGMDVSLGYPEGYDLLPDTINIAKKNAKESGGSFKIVNSMEDAFKGADIVYPKSWAPFKVMEERVVLLKNNDDAGLKALEKKCLENNSKFKSWECDEKKMKLTKNGKALYMHCLPADITDVSCKAGEVAATVFDRYRIDTYKEASYKPFVIAAMILLSKFRDPSGALMDLFKAGTPRKK